MQIGLMIEGQYGLTWERWRRILDAAEGLGYQCVFRSDHYTIGPPDYESLETWISMTYAALNTQRIEFGTLVCPTTFRHPALTARMASQVGDLSGGRLFLGLGAGWHEREHRQFGIPFYDRATRFEMYEDALEITRRMFESDAPFDYAGKHYTLEGAIMLPRPQHRTPIIVGGNGPNKTLPLAAQYAAEWNGVFVTPEDFRERNTRLTELLREQGREPASVKRSLMTQVIYGKDDAALNAWLGELDSPPGDAVIVGTSSAVIDRLNQYAEAGVERVMLQWLRLDDIDAIEHMAANVLPHFHTA